MDEMEGGTVLGKGCGSGGSQKELGYMGTEAGTQGSRI